jgi:hypothetical protein
VEFAKCEQVVGVFAGQTGNRPELDSLGEYGGFFMGQQQDLVEIAAAAAEIQGKGG